MARAADDTPSHAGVAASGSGAILAVSSPGGHLAELHHLMPRILASGGVADWVTPDTPQSRALLAGECVRPVRVVRPREIRAIVANLRQALAILRTRRYAAVVASGNIALSFVPLARIMGIAAHYIECATRTEGPSLTGRLLAVLPGVRLYTQHAGWAGGAWLYRGSVFDDFEPESPGADGPLARVVVTVGMNPYKFSRLLERLVTILPPSVDVLWQTGATDTTGLPIDARSELSPDELQAAMAAADVVVAHAGTGSSLAALDAGKVPVLVARRHARGEHSDDHQLLLLDDLSRRALAIGATVDELDLPTLGKASRARVRRGPRPPPFQLA